MDEKEPSVELNENKNNEEPEKNAQNDSDKAILGKKDDFRTSVNDPELMVEYKPKEGEPPTIKCPHCGEEMPTTIDTCVCCGHYLKENQKHDYVPMDEKRAKKIRWIVGAVAIIAFIIWYVTVKL